MSGWVERGKYNKIKKTGGGRLIRAAGVTTLFPIWYMNPSHLTRKKKREIMNLYSSASFTGNENRERFIAVATLQRAREAAALHVEMWSWQSCCDHENCDLRTRSSSGILF